MNSRFQRTINILSENSTFQKIKMLTFYLKSNKLLNLFWTLFYQKICSFIFISYSNESDLRIKMLVSHRKIKPIYWKGKVLFRVVIYVKILCKNSRYPCLKENVSKKKSSINNDGNVYLGEWTNVLVVSREMQFMYVSVVCNLLKLVTSFIVPWWIWFDFDLIL